MVQTKLVYDFSLASYDHLKFTFDVYDNNIQKLPLE